MDTAMLRGVGSERGSSAPFSVLYRSRVLVDSALTPEASLAPSSSGIRTRRGTCRPPREPWPRRWTIPARATAGLSPPAGLVPRTGVTRPGDPLRVTRLPENDAHLELIFAQILLLKRLPLSDVFHAAA